MPPPPWDADVEQSPEVQDGEAPVDHSHHSDLDEIAMVQTNLKLLPVSVAATALRGANTRQMDPVRLQSQRHQRRIENEVRDQVPHWYILESILDPGQAMQDWQAICTPYVHNMLVLLPAVQADIRDPADAWTIARDI
eukprot:9149470-Pyramimonas_sp.AAC.1